MNPELHSLEQSREDKLTALRHALAAQGWRELPDIEYTAVTSFGGSGDFETTETQTIEDIKRKALAEYAEDGFDEATVLPTDPYEKNPRSFYVFIRHSKLDTAPEKPAQKRVA